jgi:hypothetical protein
MTTKRKKILEGPLTCRTNESGRMREFFFAHLNYLRDDQRAKNRTFPIKEHKTAPSHAFLGDQPRLLIHDCCPKSTIKPTAYDEDPEEANRLRIIVTLWIICQSKLYSWRNTSGA